jgi:hypothetical protein
MSNWSRIGKDIGRRQQYLAQMRKYCKQKIALQESVYIKADVYSMGDDATVQSDETIPLCARVLFSMQYNDEAYHGHSAGQRAVRVTAKSMF